MVRPLRLEFAGALYHITARGNARQAIFNDDHDRKVFLEFLGREVTQQGWNCYAYCLMPNHYHLLIETPEPNLSKGMRRLNGVYTQYFNRHHDRVGHLFQGRYRSIVVDRDEYLLELCRYLVLNPVRAGLVKDPGGWRWSSFPATVGLVPAPKWLDDRGVHDLFGYGVDDGRESFEKFVSDGMKCEAPWKNIRGQIYLGSQAFLERMDNLVKKRPLNDVASMQRRPARPLPEDVLKFVSETYGVEREVLLSRQHSQAWRIAAYLLRRVVNLNLKEVAALFAVSSSIISRYQKEIEMRTSYSLEERNLLSFYGL